MECLWKAWHMLCQARLVIPQHTVVVAKPFLLIGLHWLHETLNSRPFFREWKWFSVLTSY